MPITSMPRTPTDRSFYPCMAIAIASIVYVGFAPTFFRRPVTVPSMPVVLAIHGLVFTAWIVLFIVQTSLVAAGQRVLHRRLGTASVGLAVVMVVLGVLAGVDTLRSGEAAPHGADPRAFLALPLGNMVVFAGFLAAGYRFRATPDAHKRWMLLATISLLPAAFGRIVFRSANPTLLAGGLLSIYGLVVGVVGLAALYDLATRGRVHPAYVWGAVVLAVQAPICTTIGQTRLWLAIAESLR